jgi:glycine/D-amino acid oxidase-like deaminating enzyme
LAGGAWSSLFCASLGIRLPQLKVLSSVMRTAPIEGPDACTYLDAVGYRKRRDGGYTLARGMGYVAPLVPDSLRYLRDFLPTIRKERGSLRVRVNAQSLRELRAPRNWPLDRPSPFEAARVLDPEPNQTLNREALAAMIALYPQFRDAHIVQQWGGYIDVTPDVIPYISQVNSLPGLTVATGFSGHGFGIGPAAGRLAAEMAIGATPCVDATAFRTSRFSDGSPIEIGPEI